MELAQPATKRNLQTLLEAAAADGSVKTSIENLIENYKTAVVDKRLSVLDILVSNPSLKIPLGTFINMLPTMRVRQYSISSSPLWNPSHCTLTVSVVSAPALSGTGDDFLGVASNFLAALTPGDLVQVVVRPSATAFTLPADPGVPLVLFCAGSGLAPMRGFIQERATQIQSGGRKDVGKVLLFYGCRDPAEDYLYSEAELKEWSLIGAVDVRPAFSRAKEHSDGCKYVQELVNFKLFKDVVANICSACVFDTAVFYTMQLMSVHSSSKVLRYASVSVSHIHCPLSRFLFYAFRIFWLPFG